MSQVQNKTVLHVEQLQGIAHKLSRQIIEITTKAGSGHPSSSLSMIDILTVLYFGDVMNHAPQKPDWAERDRFILSKGHGAPGLYVTLAKAGYFDSDLIYTLRETGSPLEGHPNMRALAGVEASTGSLGQGLSIGIGHALAARVGKVDYHVYVLIGDGEADEGQIWEAALSASKFKLDNLTCILDYNQFQQTGSVKEVMPSILPFADKWKAFGWDIKEIDGHDISQIKGAFAHAKTVKNKPQVIIAHTKKGRGLSPFEDDDSNRMHGKALSLEQATTALKELEHLYNSEAKEA